MKKFLLILSVLASANAFAGLSKWVDADGKVHHSDQPPPANVKAKTLRVTSDAAAPASAGGTAAASAPRTSWNLGLPPLAEGVEPHEQAQAGVVSMAPVESIRCELMMPLGYDAPPCADPPAS